jgi:hypothetical protein
MEREVEWSQGAGNDSLGVADAVTSRIEDVRQTVDFRCSVCAGTLVLVVASWLVHLMRWICRSRCDASR